MEVGTASQYYSFRDRELASLASTISYYRLRQVDADGRENLSPVVAITRADMLISAVELYSNLVATTELVQVRLSVAQEIGQVLAVYSADGKAVKQYPVSASALTLPVNALQAGLYHVVLQNASGQRLATQRLLVASH